MALNPKAIRAAVDLLMDAMEAIAATETDNKATLEDWKCLCEFYTGKRNKVNLSHRQLSLHDIISVAIGKSLDDDHRIKQFIARAFAGNIVFVNEILVDEDDRPVTKRRRPDDTRPTPPGTPSPPASP